MDVCIYTPPNKREVVEKYVSPKSKREIKHSSIAERCAIVYSEPLSSRKEAIETAGGLYLAVMKNSRKWKSARQEMNVGARHREECKG